MPATANEKADVIDLALKPIILAHSILWAALRLTVGTLEKGERRSAVLTLITACAGTSIAILAATDCAAKRMRRRENNEPLG